MAPERGALCLAFVGVLTVGNLRGIRDSGRLFALPTYLFIASMLALIGAGVVRALAGGLPSAPEVAAPASGFAPLSLFLLLTAFSNGCTAMTGVEAVSNGVPAFRPPESKNAASTLVTMAVLSIVMFLGITFLAHAFQIVPQRRRPWCRSWPARSSAPADGRITPCRPRRWRSSCWRRTRRTRTFRGWRRFWRAIDTCRGSS
jgi:amino acid transporter